MLRFIRDFNPQNKKRKASGLVLFIAVLSLLPQLSYSQTLRPFPVIKKVSLQVEGQMDKDVMAELIPFDEGEPFSLSKITQSIKQLYKTRLFSDIRITREGDQDVHLTYHLIKRLFTREIDLQSDEKMPSKKLKEALVSIREGSPFSEGQLGKAVEELKKALQNEGYFNSHINARVEKNLELSTADVIFEIQSPQVFTVKKIAFLGQPVLRESKLMKKMSTEVGKMYKPSGLEKDIIELKKLYNSLDYNRAEIHIEKVDFKEDGVGIELRVIPNEKLEIVIKGMEVPLSLLKPIWEERIFEEWGLSEGEAKIINHLREKGHLFASVKSYIEKKGNTLRVFYEVNPGKKYGIEDIEFEGLNYFTPQELKKELGLREKVLFLKWITGDRLFALPLEIKILYQRHGFPQTRTDLNFIGEGEEITAVYFIEEGNQEKIGSLSVKGADSIKTEDLLGQIISSQGGPFFLPSVQRDVNKIENFYLEQGFRGTEVRAIIERGGEELYSVVFEVQEGVRVKIDKIIVVGNTTTRRGTVLRELQVKEGDFAYYGGIQESKRRLEKLGIFTRIELEEIPIGAERENLLVSLREGERNYVGLGLGIETRNEPQTFAVWNIPIRLRLIAELIRNNIFGTASQVSLVGQVSLKEKRAVFSYEQPYFFGLPVQSYLNAWLEEEARKSFSYNRKGISLTGVKSFSNKELFTSLKYTRTTIFDLQISELEIDRQFIPYSTASISESFIWERRDDPFNPVRGSFFSFVVEWAYPLFETESDFLKSFLKYQHYIPVYSRTTFSSTFRMGVGRGAMPIPERFFAGGAHSYRGERFDELGPKDPVSGKPVGGKALLILNFELTFPFISSLRNLYGALFYDIGNVYGQRSDFDIPSLRHAVGLGLRYRTPLGPVRFELGWNLDHPEGDKSVLAFITIGNVF